MSPLRFLRRLVLIKNWSVRNKVLFGLFTTALIPLLIFLSVQTYLTYQDALDKAEASLARTARVGALLVERGINEMIPIVYNASQDGVLILRVNRVGRLIAALPDISLPLTYVQDLNRSFEAIINANPNIISVRMLGTNGRLLLQTGEVDIPGISAPYQTEHPSFLALSEGTLTPDRAYLIPPFPDQETGQLLLEVGTLAVNQNTLVGYLVFTLDTTHLLEQPLREVAGEREATDHLFLLDAHQWLLSSTQGLPPFSQQVDMSQVAQENQTGPVHERDWGSGPVSVIDRYSTLESLGWQAVAEVKRETIIQPFAVALLRSSLITFLAVLLVIGVLMFTFHRMLVRPIVRLTNTAQQIAAGSLDLEAPTEIVKDRQDEIGRLTQAVATMTEQLRLSIQNLERRVQERTRDLEMTATIGREASALQSIDRLLNDTVNMIVENFPQIYHAQIFLVDNVGEYANLVASTGDAGRELLRRGHRLSVGSVSVIGRVTQLGQTVIARDTDTSTSSIHRRNEFLPETRAELALPLVRGEQILGALDMQSKYADAFSPEEQRVAEALATQVAIAINNARLYEEIRERADEVEKLNRLLTRTSWEDMLTATRRRGRVEAVAGPAAADIETTGWNRWQLEAARQRHTVISPPQLDGQRIVAVPIVVRGEVLGVVDWQVSANQVSDNSRQMAEELVGRLAITLETVRLLERSERLAERERLVNQISGRLQAEPNVALILETAVQELAAILQTPDVSIQLKRPNGAPATGPTESA